MSTASGSGASAREGGPGVAARAFLLFIEVYRVTLAPLIGGFCRFVPSCSVYAEEAIRRHGAGTGVVLAARRLLRCHPFHRGGFDPVP